MYPENDLFSVREKDVIRLLIQGKSNKQIALELGIANRTVEFHLGNIYRKLAVISRLEAILKLTGSHLRKSTGGDPVLSTVDDLSDSGENGFKSIFRRIRMKKTYYSVAGLLTAIVLLIMVIVKLPAGNHAEYSPAPYTPAIATNIVSTPPPSPTFQASIATSPAPLTADRPSAIAIPPQTVNGYTASIESYYVDTSHMIFLVRLTGGERVFGDKYFYGRFGGIDLYDEYGNILNASGGVGPAVDPALYQFEFVPVTLLKGNHIKGQFAFDVENAPELEKVLAQFRFDFDLPISPDIRFYPKQTAAANNLEILLDSVTVTPGFTQIYLCFPPLTYAPWTIGYQSTLKIDGQEAHPIYLRELFNSETAGNTDAGSEPYWTQPIKRGRCLKSLFPIGSRNPSSLTLTIPQLENLMPYASDEYLQIPQLYPGLSAQKAFYQYLEDNNYTYKGPWTFKVGFIP